MPDFAGSYDQYFDVIRADTPELLDLAYRLRYQVYCIENRFEDSARCPHRREIDGDDDRSVHTLLVHRQSGVAAGTARLILPRPDIGRPLPIQRILPLEEQERFRRFPPHQTAEISRFAVSKEFRRRRSDGCYADGGFRYPSADAAAVERRLIPHITFGLLRGILGICREYKISVVAAVMEPALLRLLTRLGLDFGRIGRPVEHHGIRQPCVAHLVDLLRGSRSEASLLWEYWEEDAAAVIAAPPLAVAEAEGTGRSSPALRPARGFP
jgi:N-acyl amino acid synthase of PEP-CTERM/exosortase system